MTPGFTMSEIFVMVFFLWFVTVIDATA